MTGPGVICNDFIQTNVRVLQDSTNKAFNRPFVQYKLSYKTEIGTKISPQDCVCDLSVRISQDLSWSSHIQIVAETLEK